MTNAQAIKPEDQTPAQLKQDIEKRHPADYYLLAAKLLKDPATKQEAVFWFYVGQIRYRYYEPRARLGRRSRQWFHSEE